ALAELQEPRHVRDALELGGEQHAPGIWASGAPEDLEHGSDGTQVTRLRQLAEGLGKQAYGSSTVCTQQVAAPNATLVRRHSVDQEHKRVRRPGASLPPTTLDPRATGRQTLVERDATSVRGHAAQGIRGGAGGTLPHLDAIQRSFGAHDVSSVRAHDDGDAA